MPRRKFRVTSEKPDKTRLPEWATLYVIVVEWLIARGLLDEIGRRLRIPRRDGYCGVDIFIFLLAYHTSSLRCGLKKFCRRCKPYSQLLAAVAGRSEWPSSASVSRFLASDGGDQYNELCEWLLGECIEASVVEDHWSVTLRDTHGETWHFFDWDPTVTTLRHRALPAGPDLPEPRRRSESIAAPGYCGRKRGDVQFSRATLQHAGTGLWQGMWIGPGNGNHREDLYNGVACVRSWCERTGWQPRRTVFRSDGGAGGNVPAISLMLQAGIQYLTRIARYEILDWPEIREQLARGTWQAVEDSGSGPQRRALDLGTIRLGADRKTRDADGNRYEAVEVRVVVSRFRCDGKKRGAGIVIDGWHYELYATSLPVSHWPAPETVTAYYGRTGQENRFYQEDCELGLDRIFSYSPWGQQLANLVGLFVWNWRISRGGELAAPLPARAAQQPPRQIEDIEPDQGVGSGASGSAGTEESSGETTLEPAGQAESSREATPTADGSRQPLEPTERRATDATESSEVAASRDDLLALLGATDWEALLKSTPPWRWDHEAGLICPDDAVMRLHELRSQPNGDLLVRFRARLSACQACSSRSGCTSSDAASFKKERWFTLRPGDVETFDRLRANATPVAISGSGVGDRPEIPRWQPVPSETQDGPYQVSWPSLVPAALKQIFAAACEGTEIQVSVDRPARSRRSKPPLYIAPTAADRQQRRRTWAWRARQNALPDSAVVDIRLHGASRLRAIFPDQRGETVRDAA